MHFINIFELGYYRYIDALFALFNNIIILLLCCSIIIATMLLLLLLLLLQIELCLL